MRSDVSPPTLPWASISTVLLDMDGTLLDLHFDNVFFREMVPQALADRERISLGEARRAVYAAYQEVEGTLAWYDLNHWSRVLDMDILRLKHALLYLIRPHPQAMDFLCAVRRTGKPIHLVTNAHPDALALKLHHTPIGSCLDSLTSSHDLGHPKENPRFWPYLHEKLGFDKHDTLLVDDSEPVLMAAHGFGLGHLRHIAAPSSMLPPAHSCHFPSVVHIGALTPQPA